ncbi:MAG: putative porin [Alteromonadaceae bacterium]|nr:putative porin [Alteromonadaceae bacterium]
MSYVKLSVLSSAIAAALISTATYADVAIDSAQTVKIFGDMRIRAERDDSEKADGSIRDRERMRYRARLGIKYAVADNWLGQMRLATNSSSLNSPHVNFNTVKIVDGKAVGDSSDADIGFDQAFIAYTGFNHLTLVAGKTALNFANSTEVFWDADINPEALAAVYKQGNFTFNAAYATVVEGNWNDDIDAAFAQGVYKAKLDNSKLTFAFGGATVDSNNAFNGKNYLMTMLDWKFNKLRLIGEYIDSDADIENVAYTLQARYSLGDGWGVRAYWLHVEAFSTIGDGTFSQDDFPNPGNTGVSNYDGYRLEVDYKVNAKVGIDLRWFSMQRLVDKADLPATPSDAIFNENERSRLQLNVNYKF